MNFSYNDRGVGGKQLYIIAAAWLILVVVGAVCTWYGWFSPACADSATG